MFLRLRPYLLLFLALTVVYHANLRPVDSADSLGTSLIPFAVILDGSVTLDRFAPWIQQHLPYASSVVYKSQGHYFSAYPIGSGLLAAPLYLPAAFTRLRDRDPSELIVLARIAQKFSAVAITALSAVLFLLLMERMVSVRWAWILTLVYGLATETWSISSQALWQHGAGELAIIASFLCLELWSENRERTRVLWICGACAAAAFIFRPTNAILLATLLGALLLNRAKVTDHLRLLVVPAAGGLLLASYNWYVFHRVFGWYAGRFVGGPSPARIAGIFFSPGRGLFVYTPVALFALFAFAPASFTSRVRHFPLLIAAAGFVLLEPFVIACWPTWWGGYAWGPRLLTELAPPLIVLIAIGMPAIDRPWPRRALAALALYSLFVQMIGAFFYPNGHWDARPSSVDATPGRLWDWGDNPIVRTAEAGVYWQPYAIVGAVITGGVPAADRRMQELNVSAFEGAELPKGPELPCRACRR